MPGAAMQQAAALIAQAARFGVAAAVHPEDHIFNFVLGHPGFPSPAAAVEYYFADGAASARRFLDLIGPGRPGARRTVLEFAAGYGCVTRHLAHAPGLDLTACDIHDQAIGFLRRQLGVPAIPSHACPELFAPPGAYHAVLALSFFSHMPLATWARWLVRLTLPLAIGGRLVFTTHGLHSRAHFGDPSMPESGFWFHPASEQSDLPVTDYGQTITSPDFVRAVIATLPWMALEAWHEADWWAHQDTWVVRKRSPSPGRAVPPQLGAPPPRWRRRR
jgi:SAM-dependent methyltransferase